MKATHSLLLAVIGGSSLVFSTAPTWGQAAATNAKDARTQRLERLQGVLANENQVIDLLAVNEPAPANKNGQRPMLQSATKARDAIQRLINDVQGHSGDEGVQADHQRDRQAARKAQPAGDHYTYLMQVRQLLDQNANALAQDPGQKNVHHQNALKLIQETRAPLQSEIDAYVRAHPNVTAVPAAAPAAAPVPAAAPAAGNTGDVATFQAMLAHANHMIDILNAQPADDLRLKSIQAVVQVRNSVRQLLAQAQHESAADLAKDIQSDKTRDSAIHPDANGAGYGGLTRVQQYLKNDHSTLSRQGDDPSHLHSTALKQMEQAQQVVQQEIDAYLKAHPNQKP